MSHIAYMLVLPFEMRLSRNMLAEFVEDKVRRSLLTVCSVIDVAAASLDWEAEIETLNNWELLPWNPREPMPDGTIMLRCTGTTQ